MKTVLDEAKVSALCVHECQRALLFDNFIGETAARSHRVRITESIVQPTPLVYCLADCYLKAGNIWRF